MHTPIPRALAVVLSATVLGPGLWATAHAQTQKLRPGLWENSVTMKSQSGQLEAAMAQMQKSMASLTPAQRKQMEQAMAQRLASPQHDGQIALTFEIVYGHAFKPAPRVRMEANSTISLQDMRAMLRERT